jgi:hypothetical protein
VITAAWRVRLAFAAKAFLNVAFVGALVAGALRVTEASIRAPEHQVDLGAWTVLARPAWASLDDVCDIRGEVGLVGRSASLLDRDELTRVREQLAASPQVRRVVTLRRSPPNRLIAELELRAPSAAVQLPGDTPSYVKVDHEGVVLSRAVAFRPRRSGEPLRVVSGVCAGAPEPGLRFGADVAAGAQLARRLDEPACRAWTAFLDRVDVGNHGGRVDPRRSEIILGSTGVEPTDVDHCSVEWGRFGPAAEETGEPGFESKAGRLRRALDLYPQLAGLRRVRLAFRDLVVVPESFDSEPSSGAEPLRRATPRPRSSTGTADRAAR